MNKEQKNSRECELSDQIPVGSTLLVDEPYLAGADRETAFNSNQTLDLYVPPGIGPFPLIFWIHGGGWSSRNKDVDFAPQVLELGFALASLDYRLTSDGFPFPAQIEDCISALAWLRKNGAKYQIDTDRIGLIGHSAGAHLSALIATTGGANPFSSLTSVSTRIQCAVLWSGPFDLGRERGLWPKSTFIWDPKDVFSAKFFAEGVYDEKFAQWASPSSYVRTDLPPMLIVHGAKDDIVPVGQAIVFAEEVAKCGGDVKIRIEDESDHDVTSPGNFVEAFRYFEAVLKPNK